MSNYQGEFKHEKNSIVPFGACYGFDAGRYHGSLPTGGTAA
jgi:hypothetical protein